MKRITDNRPPKKIYEWMPKGRRESSDNERTGIEGWDLVRCNHLDSSDKFLKWAQEDVQDIKPD